MKIAIVGTGFTGLTAAYELAKAGHKVVVLEKEKQVGGLAAGFKEKNWDWPLEQTYHHLFASDTVAFNLLAELDLLDKLIIKRPLTANLLSQRESRTTIYPFDSPLHLLRFSPLSLFARLRTGALIVFCKLNPFWQPLENLPAEQLVKLIAGSESWRVLWEPLMLGKFAGLSAGVSAAWFWARIHKRTPKLCYLAGGFDMFANKLVIEIQKLGGLIRLNTEVKAISKNKNKIPNIQIKCQKTQTKRLDSEIFDRVLVTAPAPIVAKLLPQSQASSIPHLHAQTLILETGEPLLKHTYWLNILDRSFPFLAVVAHTNFMDPKHYGGHHLTYFGNYLPSGHRYLSMTKAQLLKQFLPYIQRLAPNSKFKILNFKLFTDLYAQPVPQLHYSQKAPQLKTSVSGVYLANLDSVYPWDRGINYAIALGQNAAGAIAA